MILFELTGRFAAFTGSNIYGDEVKSYLRKYQRRRGKLINKTSTEPSDLPPNSDPMPDPGDPPGQPKKNFEKVTNDEPRMGWKFKVDLLKELLCTIPDGTPVYIYFGVSAKKRDNPGRDKMPVTHVIISLNEHTAIGTPADNPKHFNNIPDNLRFGVEHGEAMN